MYSLVKKLSSKELLGEQLPVIAVSLLVAELFYKFHSFLLETGAFLVTWFVLDFAYQIVRAAVRKKAVAEGSPDQSVD